MKTLITGGQGDLAKFITTELTARGYMIDAPSRSELDVTSIDSVNNFFINKKYDLVINAAGTLYSSIVADSNPSLWIRDIEVNLIGTYLTSRAAVKSNKKVHLVNISSTAAFNSYKDWTSYCAAKAGVVTLSKGLYKDNYNVTVMCPGAVDTKLRNGLSINNPNVMTLAEGAKPILDAINTKNSYGKLFFYRKNESYEEEL
ncbi:SDR family oxidoreductase [Pseudoalteromonas nigrifaciens]|uniref:SDR family oxidoreductase n=1 Tax=Pseudoalteromonas nigrifaciens TaxID=28109 RepID=UPI0017877F09|nr:SDR family oxidoreductase [Pseudoalteromonas nigrifaciens]MBE0421293.1 SDR family oxidoreductase [Pseudoalteromonas nigrifaciens]